ncbi:MAG: hypothetical protein WAS27_00270 [Candidatus Saccharimonadales bacterium]
MPVVSDDTGRLAHVPDSWFFAEHPKDFLDAQAYSERRAVAKRKVLATVLSLRNGGAPNDTVYLDSHHTHDFASFIDGLDGARSRRARVINSQRPGANDTQYFVRPGLKHVRSPQNIKQRRRSLFSLDDIPQLFYNQMARQWRDYEPFLDLMRWHLIHEAIIAMVADGELWYMDGIWQVRPSAMDQHRGCGRRRGKSRIKHDYRPYHGRPNRDRHHGQAAA